MAVISDFFNNKILRHMQETFTEVIGARVCICAPDGRCLFDDGLVAAPQRLYLKVPVKIEEEVIGLLALCEALPAAGPSARAPAGAADSPTPKWVSNFLKLMAGMIASLCNRQRTLRLRVEELSTMYRLTAEFTGQRDLKTVLTTAAATVVEMLGAQACTIRLLSDDGKHLRIMAANNIDDEHIVHGAIRLEDSKIDQEVMSTKRMVYIPDLEHDSRVLFPEGARAEGLISALCAPLVYRGATLGVIRTYKSHAYRYDRFEHALIFAIAAQAAAAVVSARLYERAVTADKMKRQLRLAAEVQRQMFPANEPELDGFDISAVYVPCFELGGDFYDFINLGSNRTGIAIGDVVGKGIRASLLMASTRAALRAHAANVSDIPTILANMNRGLCAESAACDFVTMFYGVIDPAEMSLTYANAGHLPPLLYRRGEHCRLTAGGGVLGVRADWQWQPGRLELLPGDTVLIFTDGLAEATNFQDEAFGTARINQAVLAAVADGRDAHGIVQHVLWEMRRFAGLQTRLDDLTMVAVKVL